MSRYADVVEGVGNDLIREARKRTGLTQAQLAERVGTTQSAVARWESHRSTPSFDTVFKVVRACGLDLDLMLVERDDSDWAQAQRLLQRSVADRLAHADRVRDELAELREGLAGRRRDPQQAGSQPAQGPARAAGASRDPGSPR